MNQRRGTIVDSEVREDEFTAIAEVALNDMFGYSNALRGSTQGKGEFSMEYKVCIVSLKVAVFIEGSDDDNFSSVPSTRPA